VTANVSARADRVEVPEWNPADPAFLRDRWTHYRAWRDREPVLEVAGTGRPTVVLTRHGDVDEVLNDMTARVTPNGRPEPEHLGDGAAAAMYRVRMVLNDPPNHTRLRRLATPAFSSKGVASLADGIAASVERRLDQIADEVEVDLVARFAAFVPAAVMCNILGIEMEPDGVELISRTADYANIFSPFPLDAQTFARCEDACQWYLDWFENFIEDRRRRGGSPMVDAMLHAEDDGDRLSTIELVGLLHAFLSAGYQTTMSTIGAGVYGLLSDRRQYEALRDDPSLVPNAIEEVLRWDAPVHFARRYLTQPRELHGKTLEPGTEVLLCLAAANRDDRVFAEPDVLDVTRKNAADHIAFGGGLHLCLGFRLARLEAGIALERLVRRFPRMQLLDEVPRRRTQLVFPLVEQLRVRAA
jgi:cytochrome P450